MNDLQTNFKLLCEITGKFYNDKIWNFWESSLRAKKIPDAQVLGAFKYFAQKAQFPSFADVCIECGFEPPLNRKERFEKQNADALKSHKTQEQIPIFELGNEKVCIRFTSKNMNELHARKQQYLNDIKQSKYEIVNIQEDRGLNQKDGGIVFICHIYLIQKSENKESKPLSSFSLNLQKKLWDSLTINEQIQVRPEMRPNDAKKLPWAETPAQAEVLIASNLVHPSNLRLQPPGGVLGGEPNAH